MQGSNLEKLEMKPQPIGIKDCKFQKLKLGIYISLDSRAEMR